jgi:SAM-dependent methyltransferase
MADPHVFEGSAVEDLFERAIAVNDTPEYLGRYDSFDFRSRFSAEQLRKVEFPRLITILEFERMVNERGIRAERVLNLNGGADGDPELPSLPHDVVDIGDHDVEPDRYDMHALVLDRHDYDFVLFSQTLEHLYNPLLALDNVHDALRPGGYVFTSVPTISPLHQLPYHFQTGFTPIGLAALFAQAGFEVLEVGQWGNAKYASCLFDLQIYPTYHDLRRGDVRGTGLRHTWLGVKRFSMRNLLADGTRNDYGIPAQAWILARRPSAS